MPQTTLTEQFLPPPLDEQDTVRAVEKIIKDMEMEQIGDEVSVEKVLNFAEWSGMERRRAEDAVWLMARDGILFSPSAGVVKFVK